LAVLVSLGAIFGAVGSIYPPLRRWVRLPRWGSKYQAIAAIDSFQPGEWKMIAFATPPDGPPNVRKQRRVWVLRDGDRPDAFRVISAICPHAGCAVAWKADRKLFVCPCHGGTFEADGSRKSGPPPRSLDAVGYKVKEGQLLVGAEDS
jgi:Rieske Fe-S protein